MLDDGLRFIKNRYRKIKKVKAPILEVVEVDHGLNEEELFLGSTTDNDYFNEVYRPWITST